MKIEELNEIIVFLNDWDKGYFEDIWLEEDFLN